MAGTRAGGFSVSQPSLTAQEREFIASVNRTSTAYPRNSSLCELFAGQVSLRPDSPAVTFGSRTLTYRQLDRVTNSLAARLRELGVGRESLVALHLDRDLSVVASMLATIKAGGAYLPLDPAQPVPWLRGIAAEAAPVVLLTNSRGADEVGIGVPVIAVPEHLSEAVRSSVAHDARVDGGAGPESLAYVMYTSGSSGRPKGVCVTHRNIVRLVRDTNYVRFEPGDRVAQISNAAFDAATFEIWGTLLNGGELVGFSRETILSPERMETALRERGISIMVMATPLFNQLAAANPRIFASVSQLLVGGDVMAVSKARSVAALPGVTLVNGYGPTECTTFATAQLVGSLPPDAQRVPIGRPISNTTCYILDDSLRLKKPGVTGQLFIGGDGVARGYLGNPELTSERFLPDPFAAEPDARMYATGDLACMLPDGSMDFLGRADFQVKVRGFRVELTEIDAVLAEHPAISEAATFTVGDQAEDKSIVGCYVTGADSAVAGAPDTGDIAAFLRQRLPDYMVPSLLVRLPELPKNANLKIDRPRLAELVRSERQVTAESATGSGTLADEVAGLIAGVLSVPRFGTHENFFDSGGHSLLAVRLLTQVRSRFRVNVPLSEFFNDPTAAGIATYLREPLCDSAES